LSAARQFTTPDGVTLDYEIEGQGAPVLWQHGLGAPAAQPAEVFPAGAGLQRITMMCRGHGASDLGDPAKLTIHQFADDAVALLDHLGIAQAAVGGISLGAALALNLAARYPNRVRQLVLARPAWVDQSAPETMKLYGIVAKLLASHGADQGLRRFQALPEFEALRARSLDNANSLLGFFTRPRPDTTVALLSHIPLDGPGLSLAQMAALKIPTLIIANGQDHVHPLAYAQALAEAIPGAALREITSKSVNREAYLAEFRNALKVFLNRR
jgi:pimeloyl-ACP methyl ester carboxylesterase